MACRQFTTFVRGWLKRLEMLLTQRMGHYHCRGLNYSITQTVSCVYRWFACLACLSDNSLLLKSTWSQNDPFYFLNVCSWSYCERFISARYLKTTVFFFIIIYQNVLTFSPSSHCQFASQMLFIFNVSSSYSCHLETFIGLPLTEKLNKL